MNKSLSTKEAAAAIGIGLTRLYQLINKGEIPARKLGKRTFFLKSDIDEFLENLEVYTPKNGGSK